MNKIPNGQLIEIINESGMDSALENIMAEDLEDKDLQDLWLNLQRANKLVDEYLIDWMGG